MSLRLPWLAASVLLITKCPCAQCDAISCLQEAAIDSPYCLFYPPSSNTTVILSLFESIKEKCQDETVSIKELFSYLQNRKEEVFRFEFKYPIPENGDRFWEVLLLKAKSAHLFVPVIQDCRPTLPCRLGFFREIAVNGQIILERTLIDPNLNLVIFVEENGLFAAINQVIEEEGAWFFTGTYLYNSIDNASEMQSMFDQTFTNMLQYARLRNGT